MCCATPGACRKEGADSQDRGNWAGEEGLKAAGAGGWDSGCWSRKLGGSLVAYSLIIQGSCAPHAFAMLWARAGEQYVILAFKCSRQPEETGPCTVILRGAVCPGGKDGL